MADGPGYHNRQLVLATSICSLLYNLCPSKYDEIAQRTEYWIEYVITEQFTTIDDLVERISPVAWNASGSHSDISRFLKEFRDAPHRSEGAKSFVDKLCLHVLRWFAIASVENLSMSWSGGSIPVGGGEGFIRAASFVGHLIKCGLLSDEIVRRHLIKPLTTHYYETNGYDQTTAVRTKAIYQLFTTAGNTLLQGLLEPGDVWICFEILDSYIFITQSYHCNVLASFDTARLNELREIHAAWLQRREEEEQRNTTAFEVPMGEVDGVSVTFVPQDLPATRDIGDDAPSPVLQTTEPLLTSRDAEYPSEAFVDVRVSTASSPTLSVSTISDITSTELDDDIGKGGDEPTTTRHETFYFEDGNVEILCEHTVFRVHSTTISFSSPKLREILSQSAPLHVPMPGGCSRIVFKDSAEDFAVLLKMIYTPGFPARHKIPEFTVFASLLRMATKYGFSDVREGLVEDLKGAYPTKWEDFEMAKVLGEDIFGLPKPHPNAVLNLFLEQNIKFASPFAAYRAGLGGPSSLASDKPGMELPRLTLTSIIHGLGIMRCVMTRAADGIGYIGNMGSCCKVACLLNVGFGPAERRTKALKKVSAVLVDKSVGDVLSSLSFGNLLCVDCATLVKKVHRDCRQRYIWVLLPSLLGWESWEGV